MQVGTHNDGQGHGDHIDHHESHGSLKSYVIGFVLSIVLTIIPLLLVLKGGMSKNATLWTIVLAAVVQLCVQLFFFMHIREGEKPHYNIMALIFGIIVVIAIVGGSMWIMSFNAVVQ
ncbi:cytochrome o ubiquinol oxidase subunit IV [Paenibacillus sp. sptzw28]|uniref:cytochrome o ubiquinol oxidase subunit IV n=1 Tax=Paenibacillus sp. sptzw28 TaxID=715179 RepID=UPI001C6F49CA|nr:cytochrome o ubiquinol oxidase subunit IV [Paenibacillus sp. sptzw28]QYR24295.1 cytochrome o ubiquinol oxidase subunit IV [Paenibacillus sp. sptzw28]